MSVDTRTPGFDDQPALSMVKVPCDPAQVIVNHASFRVQLAPAQSRRPVPPYAGAGGVSSGLGDTARIPAMAGATAGRRRTPVVWSGKSEPGDPGATGLLQAVRNSSSGERLDSGATQVIPRLSEADSGQDTEAIPTVIGPRGSEPPMTQMLPRMKQAVGAYDLPDVEDTRSGQEFDDDYIDDDAYGAGGEAARRNADAVRHAYYPGRRMNLGVVLLPLRVFLGFISIYAGMGKLCDPVYFDGGERGSMVKWLTSLHPWTVAEPLRDFALSHPVGAGLTVAFLQVVVGVLTVLGLWQRVAACFGTLLSAALIMTVSWKTVPAYDAPDIIYLAAWSPLIIAGAPVYSVDGRLAGEAWRKLGPRSELWELRRRVLRRGTVVASLVLGVTLLIGSMLGGAVRSSDMVTVPGPNDDPTNHLPGAPLPQETGSSTGRASQGPAGRSPSPTASSSAGPSAPATTPGTVRETGTVGTDAQRPTQTQGATAGQAPSQQQPPPPQAPPTSAGPTSSGGAGSGGTTGGAGTTGGGTTGGSTGGATGGGGTTGGSGGSSGGGGNGGRVIGGLLG
ncbi:DoxX family membrane protein [Streptomyces chryseus]|uniref:Membrane protein n=3 Tax=Streptomyces chryseus TaxID=68186 RepID=A0ABQ3E3W5_9ACTN|nr:DoxX family membrane protein [Streptomyces chryseus]GHB20330.1 membrane protein [Streptomyces chryseus]